MAAENTLLFDYEGETYPVDVKELTTFEAIALKRHLGVNRKEWWAMFLEDDPEAMQFFVWLGWTRAGRECGKVAEIDVPMYMLNIRPALEDAPEDEADEADPTGTPEEGTTL